MTESPGPEVASIRPPAPRKSPLFRMVMVLFGGTALLSFAMLFARWSVLAEITTHFRALYALGALLSFCGFLIARQWRWSLAAAALTLWHGIALAVWYMPPDPAPKGPTLKVLTSNVNAHTDGFQRLLDLIARENPDLIFVQELSPAWAKALEAIHASYPHRIIAVRRDDFGLGFYSRYPIENTNSSDPTNNSVPISRGDVVVGGHRLHVVNLHFAPPEGGILTEMRYAQFAWLTEYLEKLEGPVIAAGDFNCTMWSPLYTDLVDRGRLQNARQGRGVLASWFQLFGKLHVIPIDQILGGGGVGFTNAHLGAPTGSDHCPLVAELRLPE